MNNEYERWLEQQKGPSGSQGARLLLAGSDSD